MSSKNIKKPLKVRLFIGILYSDNSKSVLDDVLKILIEKYGPLCRTSDEYSFSSITKYYDSELGSGLKKRIYFFEKLIAPGDIVDIKLFCNKLEDKHRIINSRTFNIDPGYLSMHNVVLVSTKNFTHRIYLDKNIYAEITLIFKKEGPHELEWTYPDFRLTNIKNLFVEERKKLLNESIIIN